MESIVKIVYQNGEFIAKESSIFGVSIDTIFTVLTTVFIFIAGYVINRRIGLVNEKSRLIELQEYFKKLIDLLEKPLNKQKEAMVDFSRRLSEKKEQNLYLADVSNFVIDQINEIDNKDLYAIFIKGKKGDISVKTELFRKLRGDVAYIESVRLSLKDELRTFVDKYEKFQDEYNENLKITSEAYDNMLTYNEQNKIKAGEDKFLLGLDRIRAEWAALEKEGIEFRDRYVAREHYIEKVRNLCKDSVGDTRAVYVLKHIMECIYAFDNIEELKYVYRRHFLLNAKGLQKSLLEIRTSLKEFDKM